MSKRKDTFTEFRAKQEDDLINEVRAALKILSRSDIKRATPLAKSVVDIINEIRINEWSAIKKYKESEKPRRISYTTLLRKERPYRKLLDIYLANQTNEMLEPSISDLELLKIKYANLDAQNEQLRNRFLLIDQDSTTPRTDSDLIAADAIESLREERIMLVDMILSIMEEASDIFPVDDEGMKNYQGKIIIDIETLMKWEAITNQLKG